MAGKLFHLIPLLENKDFDVVGLFNDKIDVLIKVINNLHESILVA